MGKRETKLVVSSKRTQDGKRIYRLAGAGYILKTPGGEGSWDLFERFDSNGMFLFSANTFALCLEAAQGD